MGDGFKFGRASKPVAGVFDVERVHGHSLFLLFEYTVIEARESGEGEATSCRDLGVVRSTGRRRRVRDFYVTLSRICKHLWAFDCIERQ
jgi:hypothetical protein